MQAHPQEEESKTPSNEAQLESQRIGGHFPLCFLPGDLCAAESAAGSWSGSAARRRNGGVGGSLLRFLEKDFGVIRAQLQREFRYGFEARACFFAQVDLNLQ